MLINTRIWPLRKSLAVDSADTSFSARTPLLLRPDWDGFSETSSGNEGPTTLVVIPFGTGDENDVFELHVILWKLAKLGSDILWLPLPLTEDPFVCTLGTMPGLAGSSFVSSSHVFCDTITNVDTTITTFSAVSVISPADNGLAYITCPTFGAKGVEVIYKTSTGDPTGMNALLQLF